MPPITPDEARDRLRDVPALLKTLSTVIDQAQELYRSLRLLAPVLEEAGDRLTCPECEAVMTKTYGPYCPPDPPMPARRVPGEEVPHE